MRPFVQFLAVFAILFGFQAGIVTSAACGLKGLTVVSDPVVAPGDADDGGALAPDVPSPSCKSMTTASVPVLFAPLHATATSQPAVRDGGRGLWRTLAIDEPPKLVSILI